MAPKNTVIRNEMTTENIYTKNKPLINSIFTGLFYFVFCWSIDFGDSTKGLFMTLMLFLPGLTFPLTTCYFRNVGYKRTDTQKILHIILSIGIYHGSVWLFSAEGRIKFITILAGLFGSLLFQLSAKYILKKNLTFIQIAITAILSGLSFLPYELIGRLGLLMGLSVFLWTIINGLLLNIEHKKPHTANTRYKQFGY
jgi:hypothetical protein